MGLRLFLLLSSAIWITARMIEMSILLATRLSDAIVPRRLGVDGEGP